MRSISSRMELTTALNSMPIEPSSRAGFTMTGNCRSCEKSRRPRNDLAKTGVWTPWKAKIFLAIALSCASISPCVPEPVYRLPISSRKPAILKSAVSSSANDSVRLNTRSHSRRASAEQALGRAVELVLDGLVPELDERLGHFVLDLLLVEGARDGRLVGGRALLGLLVHQDAVVENDDVRVCSSSRIALA